VVRVLCPFGAHDARSQSQTTGRAGAPGVTGRTAFEVRPLNVPRFDVRPVTLASRVLARSASASRFGGPVTARTFYYGC